MTSPDPRRTGFLFDRCPSCQLSLPLRGPSPREEPKSWLCARCGAEITGLLEHDYNIDDLRNVRPEPIFFDRDSLELPPETVEEFIRRTIAADQKGAEKRGADRHALIMPVVAQPLDEALDPVGQPFMATTRDISTNGIGLLHTRAITEKFLAVEFMMPGGEPVQVLLHVVRRRPRGPYHDVAGPLITKMAPAPSRMIR